MDDRNPKRNERTNPEVVRSVTPIKNSIESRPRTENKNITSAPPPSSSFISALDDRLKDSNIDKQGWRGRDDLNEVMNDLQAYAQHDRTGAHAMWRKYAPDDMALPPALEMAEDKGQSTNSNEKGVEDSNVIDFEAALKKRYLKAGDSYYYRDDTDTIAFEDKDQKLTTEHNDPAVIKSMIELAIAKGWQEIDLKGSDEFKREAWLTASINDIKTNGYSPRAVDVAKLEELQQEKSRQMKSNSPVVNREVADERKLSESQAIAIQTFSTLLHRRGDSPEQISAALEEAKNRFQDKRVYVGKVIEHGKSPYEFNQKNEDSYYLRLEATNGQQQTVWGTDIKRALEHAHIKLGDEIAIAQQGKAPTKITVQERNDAGQIVTNKTVETVRNHWAASKVEQIRSDALAKLTMAAEKTKQRPVVNVFDRNAQAKNAARSIERKQQIKTRAR